MCIRDRVGVAGSTDINTGCATSHSIAARAISRGLTGPTQSASASAPGCPPPTVSLVWGSETSVTGCTVSCYRMVFTVSNFAPNAALATSCEYNTGGGWLTDFGWNPPDITTDGNGNGGSGDNSSNCVGSTVGNWTYRIVVNGVGSNEVG